MRYKILFKYRCVLYFPKFWHVFEIIYFKYFTGLRSPSELQAIFKNISEASCRSRTCIGRYVYQYKPFRYQLSEFVLMIVKLFTYTRLWVIQALTKRHHSISNTSYIFEEKHYGGISVKYHSMNFWDMFCHHVKNVTGGLKCNILPVSSMVKAKHALFLEKVRKGVAHIVYFKFQKNKIPSNGGYFRTFPTRPRA